MSNLIRLIFIVVALILCFFVTIIEPFLQIDPTEHGYDKVWLYRGAFTPQTLDLIKQEYKAGESKLVTEFGGITQKLKNRKHFFPDPDGALHRALKHPEFVGRLEKTIGLPEGQALELSTAIKPEYRIYPVGGEMKWHRETVLSRPAQYEVVITLNNSSDSQLLWRYRNRPGDINRADTSANSVSVVRAGGIEHAVSPVTRGERVIIKAAYNVIKAEDQVPEDVGKGPPGNFPKLTTIPKHPVYNLF